MSAIDSFIPAVLRQRAGEQPDRPAYTFIDYESDPAGFAKSLTWSQVYQRARTVAAELASCGSPGDRVAICAPHGLDYVIGFLGAIEAGFIAVPLSAPQFGAERVAAALEDISPGAVLTTSAVVDDVDSCAHQLPGQPPAGDKPQTKTAMLQYTSGSTRQPTGVVISHRNLQANFEQTVSGFFDGEAVSPDTTVVSWLPFSHDMGLSLEMREPILFGIAAC